MNAVWLITIEIVKGAPIERLSVERPRPDSDPGRGRVHHQLVCAYDVCSLYSMRHSECATSRRVPFMSSKTLAPAKAQRRQEIGRASCRERVESSVVAD